MRLPTDEWPPRPERNVLHTNRAHPSPRVSGGEQEEDGNDVFVQLQGLPGHGPLPRGRSSPRRRRSCGGTSKCTGLSRTKRTPPHGLSENNSKSRTLSGSADPLPMSLRRLGWFSNPIARDTGVRRFAPRRSYGSMRVSALSMLFRSENATAEPDALVCPRGDTGAPAKAFYRRGP